jgi:hypothetical protein
MDDLKFPNSMIYQRCDGIFEAISFYYVEEELRGVRLKMADDFSTDDLTWNQFKIAWINFMEAEKALGAFDVIEHDIITVDELEDSIEHVINSNTNQGAMIFLAALENWCDQNIK